MPVIEPSQTQPALLQGGLQKLDPLATSLGQVLENTAHRGSETGLHYLTPGEPEHFTSYGKLWQQAQVIAGGLLHAGLAPQTPLLLQIGLAQNLLPTVWGCVLAGLIPVPLGVPPLYEAGQNSLQRLQLAWEMLEQPPLLSVASLAEPLIGALAAAGQPKLLVLEELNQAAPLERQPVNRLDETALILLTSGSSARPKLVRLTHHNVLSTLNGMVRVNPFGPQDISLNWLNLNHVGALMRSLRDTLLGAQQIQATSSLILPQPLHWLDLIDQWRVSLSWGPNFAFERVVRALDAQPADHGWDLSCLRSLYSSGEPIQARSVLRFIELLEPYGLRIDSMHTAWGMTESCSATYTHHYAVDLRAQPGSRPRVGGPMPGVELRIVNSQDQLLLQGQEGHLQIRGPACTGAYLGDPDANRDTFTADGWLRTGDLALIEADQLIVIGRENSTLTINGANYAAAEIEALVESLPGVAPGGAIACLVQRQPQESPQLAIFFSPAPAASVQAAALGLQIRGQISRLMGITPAYLVPLALTEIPRSEIGKPQRGRLKAAFEAGDLDARLLRQTQDPARANRIEANNTVGRVAQILSAVLELDNMRPDDNFFNLGGNSLKVAEAVIELSQAFTQQPLTTVEIFRYPTPRQLAQYFDRQNDSQQAVRQGLDRASLRRQARQRR